MDNQYVHELIIQQKSVGKRLYAAVSLLLVASILLTTASYAWLSLSRAPEITSVSTVLGSNGNLEIALNTNGVETLAFSANEDPSVGVESMFEKNSYWGNLIDLSDERYGLQQVSLKPAALNLAMDAPQVLDADSPIQFAQYSPDGRIRIIDDSGAAATYADEAAQFADYSNYGVRAAGIQSLTESYVEDVYAFSVDLLFRTNAEGANLLLQTLAVDRIYNEENAPDNWEYYDEWEAVQGSGSNITIENKKLQEAIRVAFVDTLTGEVYGIAAPDENGDLYLRENADSAQIKPLVKNVIDAISVWIYLDGDVVENFHADTGVATEMKVNLQFATDVKLDAAFGNNDEMSAEPSNPEVPAPTPPTEQSNYYVEHKENNTYSFYTLNNGSREYELTFTGSMDSGNSTIVVEDITTYPAKGIAIPAVATYTTDGEKYTVSIDPTAPFAKLSAEQASIFFVSIDAKKVGITSANVSNLFSHNERTDFVSLDLSGLDTSTATDMSYMFYELSNLTYLDVSSFDTSNVTNMECMFNRCSGLTELDVSGFDTSKVTNMTCMFSGCSGLTELDVSNFNTAKVTSMEIMFLECINLTELDLTSFDTSQIESMCGMFSECFALTTVDIGSFNTAAVKDMSGMFRNCTSLKALNLSSFNTVSIGDTTGILYGCNNLQTIVTPKIMGDISIDLPDSYLCEANGSTYTVIDQTVPSQAVLKKNSTSMAVVDSGAITDTITWTLLNNGLLRFEGTGAMPNYSAASDGPWYGYRESITEVEIGEGVTYLGLGNLASIDYAEITIPESVAAIAGHNGLGGQYKTIHYAGSEQQWNATAIFDPNNTLIGGTINAGQSNASILHTGTIASTNISWTLYADGILTINGTGTMPDWTETNDAPWDEYASSVKYLVISDGVTSVGSYAFDGLTNLQSVKIAGTVAVLGEYAFSECKNLLAVAIAERSSLQNIDQYCFNWCSNLRYINIPDTVTGLGNWAFGWCESLDRVMVNGVTTMGRNVFCGCESLTSIALAEGLYIIPDDAFARCFNLSKVTIPSTVMEIGTEAFFTDDDNIIEINYAGSREQWNLISIGYRNNGLDNAVFTFETVTVASGSVNEGIEWALDNEGMLIIFGSGDMPDFDDGVGIYDDNFPGWSDLAYHTVNIYDGITSIGKYAFIDAYDLTDVVITPSIKELSWYAFEGCDSSITIYVLGSEDEFSLEGQSGSQPNNITFCYVYEY
ncbi:MAG: leucine-rich repeat protein [Oscillospiraceae bacterium]|nr:leucine-rich repeat protein [Oscillospiraceae bacterium]